jgi:aminoglycoside phosphotransferase (APT) family kinase protein
MNTTTVVTEIAADVASRGMTLRKAIPADADRLLLELRSGSGEVIAGQWHRDHARTAVVATRTRAEGGYANVDVLDGTGILVQLGGADRRLPALRHLAQRPGARLVAHRAERRGVVRDARGDYIKAVRPGRVREFVDAAVRIENPGLAVPRVIGVDETLGTFTFQGLPGRTLERRLADPTLADQHLADDGERIGSALRALHSSPAPPARRPHTSLEELHSARRWLELATGYGLLSEDSWRCPFDRAAALLGGPTTRPVQVHRDLHDKQLLIDDAQPVGFLDFDLATAGEPAVDVANLLVHLELRSLQGSCTRDRAAACGVGLLQGYAPARDLLDRLPAYALTTRLRLAAVYAFRAAHPTLVESLLRPPRTQTFPWAMNGF